MTDIIIKVENLSKRYRIGAKENGYKTFREAIIENFTAPIRNFNRLRKLTKFDSSQSNSIPASQSDVIWALKDVSFEVKQGEVVGIIGPNGSGKSTLLKILSRITEPTSGEVKLHGRVSSLLEIGTGFHPELTGRENIYLNGAILGMRRKEIENKFDEIVDFAEIEKFIDTPVKRYSSGMYVRLAFAVAAHLEPQILLVDEVLAVGDAAFQKKCLWKLEGAAKEGQTVLFVSHNFASLKALCNKGILLDTGQIALKSNLNEAIEKYTAMIEVKSEDFQPLIAPSAEVVKISLCNNKGGVLKHIDTDTDIFITIDYFIKEKKQVNMVLNLSKDGQIIFQSINNNDPSFYNKKTPGHYRSICHIPSQFLNNGRFVLSLTIFEENYSNPTDFRDIFSFFVEDAPSIRGDYFGGLMGSIRTKLEWTTKKHTMIKTYNDS
jgi:lipopolysaccharide transport system ATP-binding protein